MASSEVGGLCVKSRVGLISRKKEAKCAKRAYGIYLTRQIGSLPYKISSGYTDFSGSNLTISLEVSLS